MSKESTSGSLLFGWVVLLGIAFILKTIPIIVGIILLIGVIECFQKPEKENQPGQEEITTIPFIINPANIPLTIPEPSVSSTDMEDAISAIQNLGTRKGDATDAVKLAIEQGATSIEDMIKIGLRNLNRR